MNLDIPRVKAFVRRSCNVFNHSVPVFIVEDTHVPVVTGKAGGHFTLGGARIYHPSAYAKSGWSNMEYRTDSRRIYVGKGWIERQLINLLGAS